MRAVVRMTKHLLLRVLRSGGSNFVSQRSNTRSCRLNTLLVAHSATQYKGLCLCLSVPPFQIKCFCLTNAFFEFLMTSIGFHMVI